MLMDRALNREKEPDDLGDETGGGSPSREGGVMNSEENGDSGRRLHLDLSLLMASGGGLARVALRGGAALTDCALSTSVITPIHPAFSSSSAPLTATSSCFSDVEGDVVADEG